MTMDPETLAALRGSIQKWRDIVASTGTDQGGSNCPLCQVFNSRMSPRVCSGCPVMERTGRRLCASSPYEDYLEDESIKNAQAELDFLISLLPPGEPMEKPKC